MPPEPALRRGQTSGSGGFQEGGMFSEDSVFSVSKHKALNRKRLTQGIYSSQDLMMPVGRGTR